MEDGQVQTCRVSVSRDQGKLVCIGVICCRESVSGWAAVHAKRLTQWIRNCRGVHGVILKLQKKPSPPETSKQTMKTQDKPSVRGCIIRKDIVAYFQCLFMVGIMAKARLWRGGRRHGTGLSMCKGLLLCCPCSLEWGKNE